MKSCEYCKKDFIAKRSNHKYCGHNCCNNHKLKRNPNNINGVDKKCPTCNIIFISKGPAHTYCKISCNINKKIACVLRNRLNKAIKNSQKAGSAVSDLGCSVEEFRGYLESQFESWMNWDNYGPYDKDRKTWQIDHKIALANLDLSNIEEFRKACHYTNLQPLCAIDNIIKSNKLQTDIIIEITQ